MAPPTLALPAVTDDGDFELTTAHRTDRSARRPVAQHCHKLDHASMQREPEVAARVPRNDPWRGTRSKRAAAGFEYLGEQPVVDLSLRLHTPCLCSAQGWTAVFCCAIFATATCAYIAGFRQPFEGSGSSSGSFAGPALAAGPSVPVSQPSLPPCSPPPPTPQPPPRDGATVVSQLNSLYMSGRASNSLAEVGVLLHTFDHIAEYGREWQACPAETWCYSYSDRFSASLVNKDLPSFYMGATARSTAKDAMGGFVLDSRIMMPSNASIFCAYSLDAGTMGMQCADEKGIPRRTPTCTPGCAQHMNCSALDGSERPDFDGYCWWSPSMLRHMMEQHQRRPHRIDTDCGQPDCNYNEVIIDAMFWRQNMPRLVEAVFFPAGSRDGEARARAVRTAFQDAFHLDRGTPPLIRYWTGGREESSSGSAPGEQKQVAFDLVSS